MRTCRDAEPLRPCELAGERGSRLGAACPPHLPACPSAADPSLSETCLFLEPAEMATLWRVCSKRWVMWPQGGEGEREHSSVLAFGKCHLSYNV